MVGSLKGNFNESDRFQNVEEWCARGFIEHENTLSIRSVKMYMDGALGSYGAALLGMQDPSLLFHPVFCIYPLWRA